MKPRTGPGWLVSSREEGAVKEETGNVLRSMITNVLCVLLRNINYFMLSVGFPGGSVVKKKNLPALQETQFNPSVGKIPWRRAWQTTSVFLPGESHGQKSLVCYSPWGRKELDMTEELHSRSSMQPIGSN